jgi:hypothetical protein
VTIRSAVTHPLQVILDLAFAVASRWLTTELDDPFLWPEPAESTELGEHRLIEDVSIDGTRCVA